MVVQMNNILALGMVPPEFRNSIRVGYGKVRGKARKYPYYQPILYRLTTRKNGELIWKYVRHCGTARRSMRLAIEDSKKYCSNLNQNIQHLTSAK